MSFSYCSDVQNSVTKTVPHNMGELSMELNMKGLFLVDNLGTIYYWTYIVFIFILWGQWQ